MLFNSSLSDIEIDAEITNLLNAASPQLNFLDADLPNDEFPLTPPQNISRDSNLFGGLLYAGEPIVTEFKDIKWNVTQKSITFSIRNSELASFFDANENINELFRQIFENYIEPIEAKRYVQYIINHDTFDRPISSCYMRKDQINVEMIQRDFEEVFQSRKKQPENKFQNSHKLIITINSLPNRIIRGGSNDDNYMKNKTPPQSSASHSKRICKEKQDIINMNNFMEDCKFVKIINSDNYCLARAIPVGKAFSDKEKNAHLLIRKNNH